MDNTSKAPASVPTETPEQTIARLMAENAKTSAENANLKRAVEQRSNTSLTVKHSKDTGTVSVGGLGRFPTSLYPDQWAKVLAFAPRIAAYLQDHAVELEQIRLARDADRRAK